MHNQACAVGEGVLDALVILPVTGSPGSPQCSERGGTRLCYFEFPHKLFVCETERFRFKAQLETRLMEMQRDWPSMKVIFVTHKAELIDGNAAILSSLRGRVRGLVLLVSKTLMDSVALRVATERYVLRSDEVQPLTRKGIESAVGAEVV